MSENCSQLEILPNEIFIEIFQYLDAGDIFRAFYEINNRFNTLIKSLHNLSIIFTIFDTYDIIYSYIDPHSIQSIVLTCDENINLNRFSNLRRLKLLNPTYEQFVGLESIILPYLEHLYIYSDLHFRYDSHINNNCNRCQKVFSNGFPSLISCSLLHVDTLFITSNPIQSIQLRMLTVESIFVTTYKAILTACPYLEFFRYRLPLVDEDSIIIKPHLNLRRMVIDFNDSYNSLKDHDINNYLSCVPNLEQLCVYQQDEYPDISSYFNYKWFGGYLINHNLPLLHRFKYHLSLYLLEELIENDRKNLFNRLEERFKYAHNNLYQTKLIIKLC